VLYYLSEIPIQDFVNEILNKNMGKGNFNIFRFLCFAEPILLDPKQAQPSFQFSFKTKKILVEGFLIKFDASKFPLQWKLEVSPENFPGTNAWVTIFDQQNQQCSIPDSLFFFPMQNNNLYSSFRFTMTGNNSNNKKKLYLEQFDIFGVLVDSPESIASLRKLVSNVKPAVHPSAKYSFPISQTMHLGLFNFLSGFSSRSALNTFSIIRSDTAQGTSVFNLFLWDDSVWTSEDGKDNYFSFMFMFGFAFNIEGYKIRSGSSLFPKSWKVEGITAKRKFVLIDEQKNKSSLCSRFAECTFPIKSLKLLTEFIVTQTNKNLNRTLHFHLSDID
jgi:hypothetical protein